MRRFRSVGLRTYIYINLALHSNENLRLYYIIYFVGVAQLAQLNIEAL